LSPFRHPGSPCAKLLADLTHQCRSASWLCQVLAHFSGAKPSREAEGEKYFDIIKISMETVNISPEKFSEALKWINGQMTCVSEKEVKDLIDSMAVGYRRRYREIYPFGSRPHLQTTMTNLPTIENICGPEAAELFNNCIKKERERNERMAEEAKLRAAEALKAAELDSVEMINSISHIAHNQGQQMTSSRAQIILFCIYGSHLAHTGNRLDIEHPQAWKYGPVFPRAYKKGNLNDSNACADSFEILNGKSPEVANLLSCKTSAMLTTPMVDLNACHKGKSSPYGKTVRNNPDHWGVQIEDRLILEFFSRSRHCRQI